MPPGREPVADVAGVGHRAGEPVELRYDEGVAFAEGGERLIQAGPRPVGAGESVVEVDPVFGDAELANRCRCAVRSCASVEHRQWPTRVAAIVRL